MSVPIEISSEALEAFRAKVRKVQGVRAVRLGVKGGSCNGLQYVIEFDYNEARKGDIDWNPKGWDEHAYSPATDEKQGGVYRINFRVDKKSVLYLTGSQVSWHKSLMKEGFEFINPNEQSRCGCGHSFSAK